MLGMLMRKRVSTCLFSTKVRVVDTPALKKTLGQHLLINSSILQKIVSAAEIQPNEVVLEIGPGTGNLSQLLVESDLKQLHLIEYDNRMIKSLTNRFAETQHWDKMNIIAGDFTRIPKLPVFDACVANIPYQISSLVVSRLVSLPNPFRCTVIMFQEEFARRLIAKPGEASYSRLSVNVTLLATVTSVVKVPRGNFLPPPRVDSRVVKIVLKERPHDIDLAKFDSFLRVCFGRKNKTLRSLFLNQAASSHQKVLWFNGEILSLPKAKVRTEQQNKLYNDFMETIEQVIAATLPDHPKPRAVKLSVEEFVQLQRNLNAAGVDFTGSKTKHFLDYFTTD